MRAHWLGAWVAGAMAFAAPATAASDDAATTPELGAAEVFWPIDMMVDAAAAVEDDPGTLPPAPGATEQERAFALMQLGRYNEARALALPLAETGDGPMAGLIARIHAEGLGVPRDDGLAVTWLIRAAESGEPAARHGLAIRRIGGDGVARDEAAAIATLRALAAKGRVDAAHDLAQLLLAPQRDEAERAEGTRHLRAAARGGIADAQYALALKIMAEAGGGPAALEWLVEAARNGLAEAQLELGLWLISGTAGRKDLPAAFGWVERAALAGLPLAKQRLAQMHWRGLGTPGDRVAAARWHALARLDGLIDHQLDTMLTGLDEDEIAKAMRGLPPALLDLPQRLADAPKRIVLGGERQSPRNDLPGVELYDDIAGSARKAP